MSLELHLHRSLLINLFSLLLIGIAVPGNSQPVCHTVKDEVDEFTRSHILNITASDFSTGPKFEWVAINGEVCLKLNWRTAQERPAVVFEGDSLLVKLENDSVLILRSIETTIGKPLRTDSGDPYTDASYCYRVDRSQLLVLAHYWVQKMRIHFRENKYEFQANVDPSWQMGLWRSANCVRQALSLEPAPAVRTVLGASSAPASNMPVAH